MQNVQIPISYVSRTGSIETITFTCGITNPVSNSAPRETIQQIKVEIVSTAKRFNPCSSAAFFFIFRE